MKQFTLLMIWVALATLISCGKDDPFFQTTHPEHGQIALEADWSERGVDVPIPDSFTTIVNGSSVTADHSAVFLLTPGNYQALLFSAADNVVVSDGIATVATTDGITEALPEWFFAATADIMSVADRDDHIPVAMKQQTRALTLELTVTNSNAKHIERVEGILTGIASTLELATGIHSSESTVEPVFAIDGNRITAHLRLLGIADSKQELTLQVYMAGMPVSFTLDLTESFSEFNSRKNSPLTISREINIQSAGGTINLSADWSKSGNNIPASYLAVVGDETYDYTSASNILILAPGTYQALLYNAVEHIAVVGNIVTASADPLLGWFFSGTEEFVAKAGKATDVSVMMHSRVREMTLELNVAEGNINQIKRITGNLSGIASTLNLVTGELGSESRVVPVITIKGNKVTLYLRLLGTVGDEQELTLYIQYTDGLTLQLTIDLTESFKNFNDSKSTSFTYSENISFPTTPPTTPVKPPVTMPIPHVTPPVTPQSEVPSATTGRTTILN